MKLYKVIPIAKGISKETLSYFGADGIPLGSLVSIPLRKKTAHAIVIEEQEVTLSKSEIKSSAYALKKIGSIKNKHFLSSALLKSALETAEIYASSTGAVLQTIIPKLVLENAKLVSHQPEEGDKKTKKEFLVIQDVDIERFAHYKSFIRGEFAKNSSVFFCLPTAEDIRRTKNTLEKGIEQYSCVLHSGLSKKDFTESLRLISEEGHPILIIGTPSFLSVARGDLGSIVLDRENSRSYRTQTRPYIDMRVFVRNFARAMGVKLIMGDLMLSVETLYKEQTEEYAEFFPLKLRMLSSSRNLLVDMKLPRGLFTEEFRVISRELEALIDKTKEENENLFIFCGRKGLAPVTVCGDCGQVVVCKQCGAPVTLFARKDENIFSCNKCGEERSTSERCTHCDSWKLETLGIGIELVEKEIKKLFPEAKVFRLDKESASTEKRASDIMKKFENTPGSILVGTEMALLHLSKPVENVAVASMDALFMVPDFRINEKIFYLLLSMRAKAGKIFLIQTRNGDETLFNNALNGNLIDFYRQEIEERKKFKYPPFSLFIKLSVEGKRSVVEKETERLLEYFKEWNPAPFESKNLSRRGNAVINILFRLESASWPDTNLLEKLKGLSPAISVKIDPESLLS